MRDYENAPPDEQAFVVKELKLALLKINVENDIYLVGIIISGIIFSTPLFPLVFSHTIQPDQSLPSGPPLPITPSTTGSITTVSLQKRVGLSVIASEHAERDAIELSTHPHISRLGRVTQ